jgi:hypothetical protein
VSHRPVKDRENLPILASVYGDEATPERNRLAVGQEIGALGEGRTNMSLRHTRSSCNLPW